MNLLSAENLSKSFSDHFLFKELNIGINEGERIALIGVNGSGKSTLLKILAGLEQPETGSVSVRKGIRVGFLGQNPIFEEEKTVFNNVFSSDNATIRIIKDYELHLEADPTKPGYDDRLHDLMEKMNEAGAWNYEQQIQEIISRLGITEYIHREVKLLSGGQRKRVAMAKVLIEEPELLILDEPTNHLDLETIEWLEELIRNRFKTLFLVTHDRYFLDRVTDTIIELEQGQIMRFKGNYGYYLEKKSELVENKNIEVEKSRNRMRKELDWIRRQPKARGTKAKYRVEAFDELKEKASQKTVDTKLELQLKTTRQGGKIMEIKRLWKSYGDLQLIKDFSYTFKRGDKIGIIGKNGTGKSTFLNLLTGKLQPDKGDLSVGETTQFGYYTQEEFFEKEDKRLIEVVKEIADVIEMADGSKISASVFLTKFMFPPADQYKFISKLSGGEKRRLQLLKILIKNPNFLILDEPTNDLDIGTLNVLEEFLEGFPGTLIIVSHDRYFMDKLVDHLFVFEGDAQIRDFPGNYTDYRLSLEDKATAQVSTALTPPKEVEKPQVAAPKANKMSFKEQREYEQLEKEIAEMESAKETLTQKLNGGSGNHEELIAWSKEIGELTEKIDLATLRWLELAEKM
ncbi:MAG: ABC-F family ATP-binding cassette domain-containing protein [Cytophagales bacterium]|nr:ABC-F family ATP-binding cassette domain-containing protein [Cytophagales bacterium]